MSNIIKYFFKLAYAMVFFALFNMLSGCFESDPVDSSDLKSSGFYADMNLTSPGNNQTEVLVCLATSSDLLADGIELLDGDTLSATANGIEKILMASSQQFLFGGTCYKNVFDFDDSGTEFVISLERNNDVDMPNSNIVLPETFSILMPTINATFNSGESIVVTWSSIVDTKPIRIIFDGDCVSAADGSNIHFSAEFFVNNDIGIHTVLVDDILNVSGRQSEFSTNSSCPTHITVKRSNTGNIDPNYGKGGVITATQSRNVEINLNP